MRSPCSNRVDRRARLVRRRHRHRVRSAGADAAGGVSRNREPAVRLTPRRASSPPRRRWSTSLDEAGRAKVQFPFEGPQKTKWSNLPSPMFQREGIRLADLTAPQRAAVDTLLSAALSRDGYRKVREIMRADGVLGRGQGGGGGGAAAAGGGPRFAEDEYFLAFLGTPSATAPWMLQFGGHHLAINLTMAGSQATHGAQPAGRAAGHLRIRRPDDPSAGQRERQGVCADQRA